ncbi:unnamed protein product [Cylicocyclus nassatus]|uniref:Uncharacterized protein n=1 Tax=Cylicocyclus nassatus TaxID=53992 RepID=A0AA36H7X8_CYLNA|nr:unnamed protein product [Cylicocyclus nassatus]
MTDFVALKRSTDMKSTVKAANQLAMRKNISHFMIFGDDQKFMNKLSEAIIKEGGWKSDAVAISKYDESMDLYLASMICSSFLITAARSTFAFWLAFFVQNQNAVYYLNVPTKDLVM